MDQRFYRYFRRNIEQLVFPVVTVIASMIAMSSFLLKDLGSSSAFPLLLGVAASVLGGMVAFAASLAAKLANRDLPKVFISYSHQDADFVDKLAESLRQIDVETIVDKIELKVGDDIRTAVDNMIDRSDLFLFVISKNSASSDWAKKELDQAMKREKKVLPVVLDTDAIPEVISGLYFADFTKDFDAGIKQLARTFNTKKIANKP